MSGKVVAQVKFTVSGSTAAACKGMTLYEVAEDNEKQEGKPPDLLAVFLHHRLDTAATGSASTLRK